MADHHSYLPSLGILVLAVWGAHQWTRAWRYQSLVLSLAGGTAIVLCIAWSRQQLRCWQDGESLFRHALQFAPDDDGLHNALGMALDKKGQTDAAIQEYHVALRLNPSSGLAHENLGVALGKKGQADEAMRQLVEAVRLSPERLEFRYNLGAVLYQQGRTNEANVEFQSALRLALRLTPRLGEIPDWGAALGLKGPAAEAIRQFRETTSFRLGTAGNGSGPAQMKSGEANGELGQCQEAVRLNPQSAAAHSSLGTALGKKGRMEEAGRQFQEAIRLAPDYAEAHNNLAVILYQQGQVEEAIRHLQEALRLKPDYAGARKNLEAALAASGRASRPPDSPPAR
jgi:Flp pilus assembly protein TadD